MRRTFTFLSAAALAMTAIAAPASGSARSEHFRPTAPVRQNMQPTRLSASQRANAVGGTVNGIAALSDNLSALANLNIKPRKAPAKAADEIPDVIMETPEGSSEIFARSGDMMYSFWGYVFAGKQKGYPLETVTSPDGKDIYLKNFVTSVTAGSWVKGEVTETGFTIPTGQYVLYDEGYGYGLILGVGVLTKVEDEDGSYLTYVQDDTDTNIEFIRNEDGSYEIESDFMSDSSTPEKVVTLFWSDDDSWSAYTDWNTTFTPFHDTASLFPDGVEIKDWVMTQNNIYYGTHEKALVKSAVKDNKFYIGGLNPQAPDNVIYGDIQDGKVVFPSNQYLGFDNGHFAFFVGATYELDTYYDEYYEEEVTETTYTPADNISLIYDAEKGTLTYEGQTAILLNTSTTEAGDDTSVDFIESFDDPEFESFTEVPAIPATPEITYFEDDFSSEGYTGIMTEIPTEDKDGNFINPAKMKYIVWTRVDGYEEEYTFYSDVYVGLEELGIEELVEVPYDFECEDNTGYLGISRAGYTIYFYEMAPDAIGLQSVYYGGGERNVSDIFWYNTSGVENVASDKAAAPAAVYGIDGIRRATMDKGINIVRMTDGSVRKVIVK